MQSRRAGEQKASDVDLLVVDNIMPSGFSPFRTIEYLHYLDKFDSLLASTERWKRWVKDGSFDDHLRALAAPAEIKRRIVKLQDVRVSARLGYVTFLNTIDFSFFFEREMPFILQLYPGGGFQLGVEHSDVRLRRLAGSNLCRKIIATQTITRDYLVESIECDPSKIAFIYGGVFDGRRSFDFDRDKRLPGKDKLTLDLCFVAHNYGDVNSKGYADFVAIARILAPQFPNLRFHVVGGYKAHDVPLGEVGDRFVFYGLRDQAFFGDFYLGMDAIVSINRPFTLLPGIFDGFPTGACIEAGCLGVLNCLNDPLGLNIALEDGKDFLLLDLDVGRSASRIAEMLRSPDRLADLSRSNLQTFRRVFNTDQQLAARTALIEQELGVIRCYRKRISRRLGWVARHPRKAVLAAIRSR